MENQISTGVIIILIMVIIRLGYRLNQEIKKNTERKETIQNQEKGKFTLKTNQYEIQKIIGEATIPEQLFKTISEHQIRKELAINISYHLANNKAFEIERDFNYQNPERVRFTGKIYIAEKSK